MNLAQQSEGVCLFCNKTFSKTGINRHLTKHLVNKTLESKPGKSFLLKVETNPRYGSSGYFLSLWMDGEAVIEELDDFFRAIWLECCGHMSIFTDPKLKNMKLDLSSFDNDFERFPGEIDMGLEAAMVFEKGQKLEYEYDFGSSTYLVLTVLGEFPIQADENIVLLSRNEPLPILCDECGKEPATQGCIIHSWEENSLFCNKCAKKHAKTCEDFEDYARIPVVNSPRSGVCAYQGGIIDEERDGVFQKK